MEDEASQPKDEFAERDAVCRYAAGRTGREIGGFAVASCASTLQHQRCWPTRQIMVG